MSVRSSLLASNTVRKCARFAVTIGAFAFVSACASDQPGAVGPIAVGGTASGGGSAAVLASPSWQEMARTLVADAQLNALAAGRAYPLLGVAQYLAMAQSE